MSEIIPLVIGGLVLFLYAISRLSVILKLIFSDREKRIITKYTSNIFKSIIIGILLTILLYSSSAVIIMTIVFINAQTLSFKQATGIVMGANIGTTLSSQIIALNIGSFAVIPLTIGLIIDLFSKKEKTKTYGKAIFYFGLLFFGLYILEESVGTLRNSSLFETWISRIDNNYIHGTLTGGLITLILQSSSATVGMAIVLGKQKLITIAGGISVMLGAELGTCSDTLLATIKGSRQAIKTGIFHFIFNLSSILLGLLFFNPFVKTVSYLSENENIGQHIANAHMLFNIMGVLIFLPFAGVFLKMLDLFLPDKINLS
jgi:phosphate:Na+ symporter